MFPRGTFRPSTFDEAIETFSTLARRLMQNEIFKQYRPHYHNAGQKLTDLQMIIKIDEPLDILPIIEIVRSVGAIDGYYDGANGIIRISASGRFLNCLQSNTASSHIVCMRGARSIAPAERGQIINLNPT